MKLRLQPDAINVRLSESEVQQLVDAGHLTERVPLSPDTSITYRVELADVTTLRVRLDGSTLRLVAPTDAARAWAGGNATALEVSSSPGCVVATIERDLPRRAK